MIVRQIVETQAIESPNGNYGTAIATPSTGATEISVVRQRQTPGGFNPAHTHNCEEVMVMLEGIVTVTSPEESTVLHAGDSVIFKAGIPHRIENTGATDAQWLIISVAGVKFFRENGDEAIPGWAK